MSYESLEGAVQTLVTTNSALVAAVTGTQQTAAEAITKANQSAANAKASETNSALSEGKSKTYADRSEAKAGESSASADRSEAAKLAASNSADTAAAVVTGGTASLSPEAGKIPLSDGEGKIDVNWLGADVAARIMMASPQINDIGVPGTVGFGVGICPLEYPDMAPLAGTFTKGPEYGNYQYKDGSVMAWVPAYFYRYGHPDNPTYAAYGVNSIHVLPRSAYPTVLAAAIAGYALHRAFYDDGVEQPGFFHDKYLCSNNDGIASSIKNGKAITSAAAHYPFNGLTGSPSNNLAGAIAAAKTRGEDFFSSASFIFDALAKLSLAHAQASTSSAACAWYDSTGVSNFPKGCNNDALGDANDSTVVYESTGHETYDKAGKTGSGMPFAKTTHNGQACGIADLNGLLWEIVIGVTILDGSYYILKKEARMADLTAGVTLDTDAWGAAGLAKNYTELGPAFGALGTKSERAIGSASQVFSSETEGLEWEAACSGIPLADGMGGTNLFGNDRLYDTNMPEHMCFAAGGAWSSSVNAGVWARSCSYSRANSYHSYGFRSALYLVKRSDSE